MDGKGVVEDGLREVNVYLDLHMEGADEECGRLVVKLDSSNTF